MSYSAVIAFAPLFNLERHNAPAWNRPGRTLYETGALKMFPGVTEIPLLVDHDENRQIGTVHEMFRMEWTNGPWLCARAVVDDAPAWLRKHDTKASFQYSPVQRRTFHPDLIARGIVSEVSVLSPGVEPAEPLAHVMWLERTAAPPPVMVRKAAASGRRRTDDDYQLKPGESWIHTPGVIHRPFATTITVR